MSPPPIDLSVGEICLLDPPADTRLVDCSEFDAYIGQNVVIVEIDPLGHWHGEFGCSEYYQYRLAGPPDFWVIREALHKIQPKEDPEFIIYDEEITA